ncbi:MAG: hypothetical protein IT488_14165 [Gammaproteobacteria bacterium]|nr:hypothetical protein [Gammaproteobacteria bacterium]
MKHYGIKITLPPGDTLNAAHLLGSDWEYYRWYDSKADRDRAYEQMLDRPPYYRRDEDASQTVTKVERV